MSSILGADVFFNSNKNFSINIEGENKINKYKSNMPHPYLANESGIKLAYLNSWHKTILMDVDKTRVLLKMNRSFQRSAFQVNTQTIGLEEPLSIRLS